MLEIVNSHLCTGCGTCVGMCPNDAISMVKSCEGTYIPIVENSKCTNCGLCIDVCPGYSVDFNELNKFTFGKVSDDVLLGNYINCYVGFSSDKEIRWNASSGGVLTALLIFALREGFIDGAIVTRMSNHNPLEPETALAENEEQILSAAKSKYCPVSANLRIRDILRRNGKFAFVGLPCHLQGVRKAEMLNRKLKEKIVLHFGLFCSHTSNFLGTEYLLKMINVRKQDVTKIEYRGKGWPGFMTVRLVGGNEVSVPMNKWYVISGSRFFCPVRCMLCSDATSELSDISFGDAWLPELRNNHIGVSVVISRSRVGQKILEDAQSKGKIHIVKIDRDKVLESQKDVLNFKKKSLAARLFLWRLFDKSIPSYNSEFLRPGMISYVSSFYGYLTMSISLRPCLLQHLFFDQGLFLKDKVHRIYRGVPRV